jgi:succinate-acetate transporter protein
MTDVVDYTPAVAPTRLADSIADPGPLGLAGFAMTTFFLSSYNAGLITGGESVVLGLALVYGGIAQLLAGMWEFRKGNTFGAVAFSSYGAFWISFWVVLTFSKDATSHSLGLYVLGWTIFTAYMTVAALKTSGAVLAVFVALTITFLFLAIGYFAESKGMTKVGGYVGLATAALAWYASFAGVTNATWKRTVLPTWPLS